MTLRDSGRKVTGTICAKHPPGRSGKWCLSPFSLQTFINKLGGLLASAAVRGWMATVDCRAVFRDPDVDPCSPRCLRQKIYIFWHEYILLPLYLRGHCNLAMLLSRHRDAEVLSRVAYHLGFDFVRGSTSRGGVSALRQLLAKSRQMHLAITPDGPRGPRRRLAPGAVYLASKLDMPLIAMGYGYDRPWRVNSWDRFAVARPFSRVRIVLSQEIYVPPDLDRDGLEHCRRETERLLSQLTEEAEAWAESGLHKPGEMVLAREPFPLSARAAMAARRRTPTGTVHL